MKTRIDKNPDGTIDDAVFYNAYIHLEQMDETWFSLSIEDKDKRYHFYIGSVTRRSKVDALLNDESPK